MNKIAFALVFSLLTVAAFGQKVKQVKGDDYGDGIKAKTYVTYDDMFSQLNAKDTVDLTVRATVDEVCQAKGCWLMWPPEALRVSPRLRQPFARTR